MNYIYVLTFLIYAQSAFGAASEGETKKIAFAEAFTIKTIEIPGHLQTHSVPLMFADIVEEVRVVGDRGRKKHLAPSGRYSYRDLKGCIGFIEGPNEEIANAVADELSKMPIRLKRLYYDKIYTIEQLLDVVLSDMQALNPRYKGTALKNISVSAELYDEDFKKDIIAPESVRKVFEEFDLNIENPKHVLLMNGYAKSLPAYHQACYLVLNHEREHEFRLQEGVGKRIEN